MDLWEATNNNDIGKVRSLLGQGADPNHQLHWSRDWLRNKLRDPPVHQACVRGYQEITSALVSDGADVEKADGWSGKTAFHNACLGGNMETVKYLFQVLKCCTGRWLFV